ncbi:hypothetical protein [Paraflavitalea pollutisoli]|uniref:hypothetical protein n=1 Tax=Paraflavitalea pollutisoli TaxID=3034143 RepID=UPI0023EDF27C|nr:hypothetical protein [Paraflavitalea sp. H1-2-19X]
MNNAFTPPAFTGYFDEKKFIDAIMCFAKMRNSLNTLSHNLMYQLPRAAGPWTSPSDYHFTAYCLEVILRRHYAPFKPSLQTLKFTIPPSEIAELIFQAHQLPAEPIVKVCSYNRFLDAGRIIGRDENGKDSSLIKIVVDNNNWVQTAYPVSAPISNL